MSVRMATDSSAVLSHSVYGAGSLPIVFLHPIGLTQQFWSDIVARLGPEYRAVVIDLPGHGDSPLPAAPFSIRDVGQAVITLLAALDLPPAIIVGCSFGGMIAQSVAIQNTTAAAGLVLANTAYRIAPEQRGFIHQRAEAAMLGMERVTNPTVARWLSADFQARYPGRVAVIRTMLRAADPIAHAWSWRAIADLDHAAELAALAMPTLIVTGSEDQSASPQAAAEFKSRLPHAEVTIMNGAGHLAPYEQDEVFTTLLETFVRRID